MTSFFEVIGKYLFYSFARIDANHIVTFTDIIGYKFI
jgi:hypothetical protein